ncbi:MAG: polysaccharide deacetylase family protein, partial [Chloroflexota bacterium]
AASVLPEGTEPATAIAVRPSPSATAIVPVPSSTPDVPSPTAVALTYLQALQAQQWASMWHETHPQARNRWSSEQAFAAFLAEKFAPAGVSIVKSVSVDGAQSLTTWNDVRFVEQAASAVAVPASVTLLASAPLAVPPTDLNDKAPLVLLQEGGQWKVVDGGPADLQGPVLVPNHPAPRRLRVPILMYHHIAPAPQRTPQMGDFDYRLAVDLTVTPVDFAAQLDWLAAHGYQTITLQQVMAGLYDGVELPPQPIVLSFDDGYADNAQFAAPALLQRRMVGAFNIVTGLVGSTGGPLQYMNWSQITVLAAEGMQIESHTVSHRDLGTLTEAEVQTELVESRQIIAQHLGQAPQFLCYPSGEPFRSGALTAQQRLLLLAPRDGYVGGLLDPRIAGAVQSSTAPEQLTRIRVSGQESLSQFAASIVNQPGP